MGGMKCPVTPANGEIPRNWSAGRLTLVYKWSVQRYYRLRLQYLWSVGPITRRTIYAGTQGHPYYNIVYRLYDYLSIEYTRNELALLAHSFYTCLKHQLMHLTKLMCYSDLGSMVISFTRNFIYTVEKLTIGHVAALNYITNARTRMCTSLTDHHDM